MLQRAPTYDFQEHYMRNHVFPSPSPLLDTRQAALYLALSETTLISWRSLGRGPRFVRVGRAVRYRQADLDAFIVIMPCEESQP